MSTIDESPKFLEQIPASMRPYVKLETYHLRDGKTIKEWNIRFPEAKWNPRTALEENKRREEEKGSPLSPTERVSSSLDQQLKDLNVSIADYDYVRKLLLHLYHGGITDPRKPLILGP